MLWRFELPSTFLATHSEKLSSARPAIGAAQPGGPTPERSAHCEDCRVGVRRRATLDKMSVPDRPFPVDPRRSLFPRARSKWRHVVGCDVNLQGIPVQLHQNLACLCRLAGK